MSILFKIKSDLSRLSNHFNLRKYGDPVLREEAIEVPEKIILTDEFRLLTRKMIQVMREHGGQGIAAAQVGISLAVIAVEFSEKDMTAAEKCFGKKGVKDRQMEIYPLQVLINPKIRVLDYKTTLFEEGCLSIVKTVGYVPRFERIQVEALNTECEKISFEVSGWMARIIQHELHHLKGLLITDYFVKPSRSWLKFSKN